MDFALATSSLREPLPNVADAFAANWSNYGHVPKLTEMPLDPVRELDHSIAF